MASKTKTKTAARQRRHARVRRKIHGTAARPRLAVFRSNTNIYAQVIDDDQGHTLVAASSLEDDLSVASDDDVSPRMAVARAVGQLIAERAQAAGIAQVVLDRGGNRYHGRVRALADGAREGGLKF